MCVCVCMSLCVCVAERGRYSLLDREKRAAQTLNHTQIEVMGRCVFVGQGAGRVSVCVYVCVPGAACQPSYLSVNVSDACRCGERHKQTERPRH